jgi:hypothetical protein
MRSNFFARKRAQAAHDAGKIAVDHRQRLIIFRYKGEQYKYVYESSMSHGFSNIYDCPYRAEPKCIYSTSNPSLTTDLGREIHDALHKQNIITDAGA